MHHPSSCLCFLCDYRQRSERNPDRSQARTPLPFLEPRVFLHACYPSIHAPSHTGQVLVLVPGNAWVFLEFIGSAPQRTSYGIDWGAYLLTCDVRFCDARTSHSPSKSGSPPLPNGRHWTWLQPQFDPLGRGLVGKGN